MTKHMRIAGGRPLETKDGETELDELKTAFEGYHGEAKKAAKETATKLAALEKQLADEKKEREDLEARLNRKGIGAAGEDKLDAGPEHKALAKFVRTGDESEIKAMSVGSDPDGGYFVMPVMSQQMTTRLYDQSPMRQLCRVETITAGDSFEEIDDRGDVDASWVGEHAPRPAQAGPQIGKWKVPVHEIYALQKVTQRLLDDSGRDLGGWLDGKITDKFGRTEGSAFVSGDGVGKPRGFLDYDKVITADFSRPAEKLQYVKTGVAAALTDETHNGVDALKSLMWTLRAPYRRGATWLMNSTTASTLDRIKDENGQYLWRPGMTAGAQSSLLGYPVEIDETMPNVGANEFPVAFGNFQLGYCIVDKAGIKMLRDPYTDKPNVLFYAYRRVGGGLANDDAIKLLKCEA